MTATIEKTAMAAAFEAAGIGDNSNAFAIDLPGDAQMTIQPDATQDTESETADNARASFRAYVASEAIKLQDAEKAKGETAKQWSHKALRLAFYHKIASIDEIIGDTKTITGWDNLAGDLKALKNVYNVWFSNLRTVAEQWGNIDDALKADLLNGVVSVSNTVKKWGDERRAAKREAAKAAKAEADNAKADGDNAADNAADNATDNAKPATLADTLTYLTLLVHTASDAEIVDGAGMFDNIASRYSDRLNKLAELAAQAA